MRKNMTAQKQAQAAKEKHDRLMKGKKTILVPHPTIPKLWIEKIVSE